MNADILQNILMNDKSLFSHRLTIKFSQSTPSCIYLSIMDQDIDKNVSELCN